MFNLSSPLVNADSQLDAQGLLGLFASTEVVDDLGRGGQDFLSQLNSMLFVEQKNGELDRLSELPEGFDFKSLGLVLRNAELELDANEEFLPQISSWLVSQGLAADLTATKKPGFADGFLEQRIDLDLEEVELSDKEFADVLDAPQIKVFTSDMDEQDLNLSSEDSIELELDVDFASQKIVVSSPEIKEDKVKEQLVADEQDLSAKENKDNLEELEKIIAQDKEIPISLEEEKDLEQKLAITTEVQEVQGQEKQRQPSELVESKVQEVKDIDLVDNLKDVNKVKNLELETIPSNFILVEDDAGEAELVEKERNFEANPFVLDVDLSVDAAQVGVVSDEEAILKNETLEQELLAQDVQVKVGEQQQEADFSSDISFVAPVVATTEDKKPEVAVQTGVSNSAGVAGQASVATAQQGFTGSGEQQKQGFSQQATQFVQQQVSSNLQQAVKDAVNFADEMKVVAESGVVASPEDSTESGRRTSLPNLASINYPLRHQSWPTSVGKRLVFMVNNQLQQAQITLNPDNLGPIKIRLQMDKEGGLSVAMTAHHGMTREALEQAIPRLRDMLNESGIKFSDLSVQDENDFNQAQDQQQKQKQRANAAAANEDVVEPNKVIETDNLIDYYA